MTDPNILLRAAVAYARRGWQVVPLNQVTADGGCTCPRGPECRSQGKHPRVRWKEHGGSIDITQIERWWRRWPRANIAILTGIDRSGLFVVDIDPRHGGDATLDALTDTHGPLPETLTAVTGSGGRHLVFRHPGDHPGAKQGAGGLGPGLDTRSDGGIIVAAPSVHASGGQYQWANWWTEPAPVPTWILERLRRPEPVAPIPMPRRAAEGFAGQVLEERVERIRRAPRGERNNVLNSVAYYLATLIAAGLLTENDVRAALIAAAINAGLGETEARDTIDSGLSAGYEARSALV